MSPYQHWLGTRSARPDFYELLGLDAEAADPAAVTAAAQATRQRLSAQAPGEHLDRWQAMLKEIDLAGRTLADPRLRQAYDGDRLQQGIVPAAKAALSRLKAPAAAGSSGGTAVAAPARPAASARSGFDPMAPLAGASPRPAVGVTSPISDSGGSPAVVGAVSAGPLSSGMAPARRTGRIAPTRRRGPSVGMLATMALTGAMLAVAVVTGLYLYGNGTFATVVADIRGGSGGGDGITSGDGDPSGQPGDKTTPTGETLPLTRPAPGRGGPPAPAPPADPDPADGDAMPAGDGNDGMMAGPDPPPADPPEPPAPPAEVAAVTRVLAAALPELRIGRIDAARTALAGGASATTHPGQLARLEAFGRLADRLEAFWTATTAAVVALRATEEIVVGSSRALVVEGSPERLVIRAPGQNRRYPIREIPPGIAAVLAQRRLPPGDPLTTATMAAFWATRNPPQLDRATALFSEAEAGGAEIGPLPTVVDEIDTLDAGG